jgi:hypothetical protein
LPDPAPSDAPDPPDPDDPAIIGLRVIDPMPARGLVDTIIGDVASFFFGS